MNRRRRAGSADRSRRLFIDRLAQLGVDLAVAGVVGAPVADREAIPRLVPQLHRVHRALRPAPVAGEALDELLEILVTARQPGGVGLAVEHHALVVEVRPVDAHRMDRASERTGAELDAHRQLGVAQGGEVLGRFALVPLLEIGVGGRLVADAGAVAGGAEAGQHVGIAEVHGQAVELAHLGLGLEGAHGAGAEQGILAVELDDQGVAALAFGQLGADRDLGPALACDFDPDRGRAALGDAAHADSEDILSGRDQLVLHHAHAATGLDLAVGAVDELEGELRSLTRPGDIRRRRAADELHFELFVLPPAVARPPRVEPQALGDVGLQPLIVDIDEFG